MTVNASNPILISFVPQFAFVETVCVYIEESFPRLGKRRVLFRAAFAGTGFLSSLVFCTKVSAL